jgi:prepilin-type N-terminal cleavage/methylation domain-containing protein
MVATRRTAQALDVAVVLRSRSMGRSRYALGFSLVELVVVMVILAIMAASVGMGVSARTSQSVVNAADTLRRDLSHVQALALAWGARLRLTVAADGLSYSVTCQTALARAPCNAVGDTVIDPATGLGFIISLPSSVTLAPANNTLDFDSLGRPVGVSALVATNPAVTYTLAGGSRTATVEVQPITGLALASY